MSSNAKLAYLLSTCFKLTDDVINIMTRQYEESRTLATRHFFNFYINFHEPIFSENFEVDDVYCKFANSKDPVLTEALQYYNNKVLDDIEMKLIYNNLIEQKIKLDAQQIVAIYSIATLIKLYKQKGYRYIFIPIIINYGRNPYLLHQTAMIMDLIECKIIYYEPYGKYQKFGKSYKEAVGKLFQCFRGFVCFEKDNIDYTTYHKLLNIDDGIQHIILEANNKRAEIFQKRYDEVVVLLNKEFPNVNFTPNTDDEKILLSDDKTIVVLDILFNVDRFDIDNLSEEKKKVYYKILNTILTQYCCFNSKTCVSITIVEMNKFFEISQRTNHNLKAIRNEIHNMYQSYKNTETPNIILMNEIYSIIDLFKNKSQKIKEILSENKQINNMCQDFKSI